MNLILKRQTKNNFFNTYSAQKTRYNQQLNKQHKSFIEVDLLINKQKTKLKIYNRFIDLQ